MADLKTNYVDDVLDSDKNQFRKYQMIYNDDGTVSFVDVTTYTQNGDSFGAKDINDTNAAVNELNSNLSNNFGEPITIPLDTPYTCPSDGVVKIAVYFTAYLHINVNGLTVSSIYGGSQSANTVKSSWRVRKGDIVNIFSTGTSESSMKYITIHDFVPYKV